MQPLGQVAVEISGSTKGITAATVSRLAAWLEPEISATPVPALVVRVDAILLITRTTLTRQSQTLVENLSARLVHVVVRGTEDEERLAEAVAEVLRRAAVHM